nr:MAG TPA: hypothetical protein [Caudoviricetes sp.]
MPSDNLVSLPIPPFTIAEMTFIFPPVSFVDDVDTETSKSILETLKRPFSVFAPSFVLMFVGDIIAPLSSSS